MKCIILIYVREVCSVLRHNSSIFPQKISNGVQKALYVVWRKKGDQENRCTEQVAKKKKPCRTEWGWQRKLGLFGLDPHWKRTFFQDQNALASLKRQPPWRETSCAGVILELGVTSIMSSLPQTRVPSFLFLLPMRIYFGKSWSFPLIVCSFCHYLCLLSILEPFAAGILSRPSFFLLPPASLGLAISLPIIWWE